MSVGVKRYSSQMKSSGTFGEEGLQEALEKESGAKIEFVKHYKNRMKTTDKTPYLMRDVPNGDIVCKLSGT